MKKWFVFPILILFFTLTGCGNDQEVTAEQAANTFIDRLIFEKSKQKFSEEFVSGQALAESFDKSAQDFQESFVENLQSVNTEMSEEDAVKLTRSLVAEMDGKATYNLKNKKVNGDFVSITFEIYGLDFSGIIEDTVSEFMREYELNLEVIDDESVLERTFAKRSLSILKDEIGNVETKEKPVEVSLVLKQDGKRWQIADNQEKRIAGIFMAFLTGAETQENLNYEISNVIYEKLEDFQEDLESRTESSKEKTKKSSEDESEDSAESSSDSTEESK